MNVIFDTRLPRASLVQEARAFFGEDRGLTGRDEGADVLVFQGPAGIVRLALGDADAGLTRVDGYTDRLESLLQDFQARVSPPSSGSTRRPHIAQMRDLQRYRRLAERQAAPPRSAQARSTSFGGGLMPG